MWKAVPLGHGLAMSSSKAFLEDPWKNSVRHRMFESMSTHCQGRLLRCGETSIQLPRSRLKRRCEMSFSIWSAMVDKSGNSNVAQGGSTGLFNAVGWKTTEGSADTSILSTGKYSRGDAGVVNVQAIDQALWCRQPSRFGKCIRPPEEAAICLVLEPHLYPQTAPCELPLRARDQSPRT